MHVNTHMLRTRMHTFMHTHRANQTKLLRLERDKRELERSLQVLKLSSEKAGAEMEKMNRKLTAQIHADKKEIARLKEVGKKLCNYM